MGLSATVELLPMYCGTCGIAFAIPVPVFRDREKFEEDIYCPNGHAHCYGNRFQKDDDGTKDSPKVAELRKELVLAIHRAEQAEARATEVNRPGNDPNRSAAPSDAYAAGTTGADASADNLPMFRDVGDGWRIGCPLCDKHYSVDGDGGWLRRHMVENHGWTNAQVATAARAFHDMREGAGHAK